MSQNNEMVQTPVSQTSTLGIEPFLTLKKVSLVPVNLHSCWRRKCKRYMECFQRGYSYAKFIGTKESV